MASELLAVESFTIDSMIRGFTRMFGPVLLEKCCTAAVTYACNHHDPFAITISINRSKLSNFCLVFQSEFYVWTFLFGYLASATPFKTSLFASAIDTVAR